MTTIVNRSGRAIDWAALESFRLGIRGEVIPGDDDRYERSRLSQLCRTLQAAAS